MKISKESEQKIAELQLLEQSLQNFLLQKQTIQTQIFEIGNALGELKKTKDNIYKAVGPIIVLSKKEGIEKELKSKKDMFELRIKSIEKQEERIKEKAAKLQAEVMKELEK